MRSDDAGDSWREVSGNLPTDFGFTIDVHAHEPETIYVVPIKSDSEHFPLDGRLRVYRSRTGGERMGSAHQRVTAARLLRQRASRCDGGRCARFMWHLFRHDGWAGLRFGRFGRHVDADRARFACGAFGRGADTAVIRVVLPAHLRTLARVDGEVNLEIEGEITQRRCSTRSSRAIRRYGERSAISSRRNAARTCGSSPASGICHTSVPTRRFRPRSQTAPSRFSSSARWREARLEYDQGCVVPYRVRLCATDGGICGGKCCADDARRVSGDLSRA